MSEPRRICRACGARYPFKVRYCPECGCERPERPQWSDFDEAFVDPLERCRREQREARISDAEAQR